MSENQIATKTWSVIVTMRSLQLLPCNFDGVWSTCNSFLDMMLFMNKNFNSFLLKVEESAFRVMIDALH